MEYNATLHEQSLGKKNRILNQEQHLTMQEEEALTRLATIKYQKHSQMIPW